MGLVSIFNDIIIGPICLIKKDLGFAGVDLPGHGRSEGKRGNIKNYAQVGEMIDILLNDLCKNFPGTSFLYGHSLGGGMVLDYLLHKNPRIKGAIVTVPYFVLSFEPPKIKLVLASVMKNLLPGLIQPTGLNRSHISHDETVVEKYKKRSSCSWKDISQPVSRCNDGCKVFTCTCF